MFISCLTGVYISYLMYLNNTLPLYSCPALAVRHRYIIICQGERTKFDRLVECSSAEYIRIYESIDLKYTEYAHAF